MCVYERFSTTPYTHIRPLQIIFDLMAEESSSAKRKRTESAKVAKNADIVVASPAVPVHSECRDGTAL